MVRERVAERLTEETAGRKAYRENWIQERD